MLVTNIFSIIVSLYAVFHTSEEYGLNNEEKKAIVKAHNKYRSWVKPTATDMLKMNWNDDAARNAQDVASSCTGYHSHPSKRTIKKPSYLNCGENIYMSTAKDDWEEVIKDWHDEVFDFVYGRGAKKPHAAIGHYTQLVWANTSCVGCGMAECGGSFPYVFICHYCPAGNDARMMATPYCKGKPCSACKGKCEDNLCIKR
ncbi:allurin-like [Pseudophryne corroboree]|uniref:allurin-like n=1 Tax=Pseudophryne corroboree TaxID=495146 RepID=UPI003081A4CD